VHGDRLRAADLSRIDRWTADSGVDCLYFLADAADAATPPLAEAHGFHLVDVRITLDRTGLAAPVATNAGADSDFDATVTVTAKSDAAAKSDATVAVRPARPADLPALRRIAAASHHDSRFYFDPRFDSARCDALYAHWIETCCADASGLVLVATLADADADPDADPDADAGAPPAGYITGSIGPDGEGRIGLFAVAAEAQGRGAGRRLIAAAEHWFAARGARSVAVVTQGRNVRAQRIYQRAGLRTRSLGLWYHRWTQEDPDQSSRGHR
jgi:dTDP-4-amino-4,6-dideoxy-D-galactose acyltransferase